MKYGDPILTIPGAVLQENIQITMALTGEPAQNTPEYARFATEVASVMRGRTPYEAAYRAARVIRPLLPSEIVRLEKGAARGPKRIPEA